MSIRQVTAMVTAYVATVAVIIVGVDVAERRAQARSLRRLPACLTEDSTGCRWDCHTAGNRQCGPHEGT